MTESDQGTTRRVSASSSRSGSGGAATVSRSSASGRSSERNGRGNDAKKATSSDRGSSSERTTRNGAPREQRGTAQQPAAGAAPAKKAPRKPRRARLRLTQIDAWSVMKTAFLLSIAMGIVAVVAVGIVWTVLGAAGVWDSLNNTIQTALGNDFQIQDYIGTGRVLGFTMLVSVVDVVLLTAIATLGAFLYNLAATLLGGLELTLTEDG